MSHSITYFSSRCIRWNLSVSDSRVIDKLPQSINVDLCVKGEKTLLATFNYALCKTHSSDVWFAHATSHSTNAQRYIISKQFWLTDRNESYDKVDLSSFSIHSHMNAEKKNEEIKVARVRMAAETMTNKYLFIVNLQIYLRFFCFFAILHRISCDLAFPLDLFECFTRFALA